VILRAQKEEKPAKPEGDADAEEDEFHEKPTKDPFAEFLGT
jgi:hypothetical protein